MDKAKISLRISALHWPDERRNEEILALLRAHPEVGEVAFFTSVTHPPLPLEVIRERAKTLAAVIPRYRAAGVRAGINHLSTIGHLDENLDNSLKEPWQRLVDSKGREAGGSFCLGDERMRGYVRETYRALAQAKPDFIWIDDDLRLEGHMPIDHACFCPLCLKAWSAATGREWTRETLVASFNEGTHEEKQASRRAWLDHNRAYIGDGIRLIRGAVDEVDPSMPLGFMTGTLAYSGMGYERWARDLSGDRPDAPPAMWRPGGGFYSDDHMPGLLGKAHSLGMQIALIPPRITDIQYELENFPYHRIKKSATALLAEITASIGSGCTGVALNTMGTVPDPIGEFGIYFDRLQKAAPFLDRAVEAFGRSPCEGVGIALSIDSLAALNPNGAWLEGNSWAQQTRSPDAWGEIGLPLSYGAGPRSVTVLAGDSVLSWTLDEIRRMLSGGVVLDGAALAHVNAMGLGHLSGFAIRHTKNRDTLEVFTGDPLNGSFAGQTRDCRPSFWPEAGFALEPTHEKSRVLSEMTDFKPQTFGAAGGVFENELGGRVAVLGYYPWSMVHSLAKTEQLKALCRWLSRDTLPAYVGSYAQAVIWCRRDAQGRPAFLVMNASLDVQDIEIRVLDAPAALQCVRMDGGVEKLSRGGPEAGPEPYSPFTIPNLGAWQAALIHSA